MTRNSRSAIPGRGYADDRPSGRDLDRLVFGGGNDASNDPARDSGRESAIRDADARADREFAERASAERRKAARRKSDYSKLPDEADGYRAVEDNKRGPLILALAIAIVGVFGAVVWNAYREGVRPADGVAAPKLASAGAFKTRPEPSADAAAPDEEASVFERVEAPAAPAAEVETVETTDVDMTPTPEVRPETPAPQIATAELAPPKQVAPAPAVVAATPPVVKPAPVQTATAKPAAASPAVATPAVALSGGYTPAFSASGGFVVQLAAPSTEAGALAEWEKRKKAMPELFASAERLVVRADVNGKTVYRVRAGSFASAADADAFCGAIKGKGGDCYRTTK